MSISISAFEKAKRSALRRLGDLKHPQTGQKIEIEVSHSAGDAKVGVCGDVPQEIVEKITEVFGEEVFKMVQEELTKSLEKSLGKAFRRKR